jgi:ZIP family zinc transporter
VYISFRELLPTARSYDPDDRFVTKFLFLGMVIMAASLMLFLV